MGFEYSIDQIVPGVYMVRLPLPVGPPFVNVYLIEGDQSWGIIDTGMNSEECGEGLNQALRSLGLTWKDIGSVALTHHHVDHMGGAGLIQQESGAVVLMSNSAYQAALYASEWKRHQTEHSYYLEDNGFDTDDLSNPLSDFTRISHLGTLPHPELTLLDHGAHIHIGSLQLRAIATPGHAEGHLCYLEPTRGILFSGDHLLPEITPIVMPYNYDIASVSLGDYIDSLQVVPVQDVELVLPGHGPVFSDLEARISSIKMHHRERLELIYNSVIAPRHATAIASTVFGELGLLDKMLALSETLAHLQYLVNLGFIERLDTKPVLYRKKTKGNIPTLPKHLY